MPSNNRNPRKGIPAKRPARQGRVVRTTVVPGMKKAAVVSSGPCLMVIGEFCTVVVACTWIAAKIIRRR